MEDAKSKIFNYDTMILGGAAFAVRCSQRLLLCDTLFLRPMLKPRKCLLLFITLKVTLVKCKYLPEKNTHLAIVKSIPSVLNIPEPQIYLRLMARITSSSGKGSI